MPCLRFLNSRLYLRGARLEMLADRGVPGAHAAIALSQNPGKFLSTVQIGITLVGIVAGAYSGATLGSRMGQYLFAAGGRADIADVLGYILVIGVITFLSVIIGELVPKTSGIEESRADRLRGRKADEHSFKDCRPCRLAARCINLGSVQTVRYLYSLRKRNYR